MGKGCDMDEEPYRWLSMRSGLDRSTFDAHARRGLRLRTSRAARVRHPQSPLGGCV